MVKQIAIDGPAGAGKSTVAKAVALALGMTYLDTGAMYRAVAWAVLARGGDAGDEAAVAAVAAEIELKLRDGQVLCNGTDVTEAIRLPEVNRLVPLIAAQAAVRARMVELQREIARTAPVVMDGRDIGTHVLPQAELKVFLTADAAERARRRVLELRAKGQAVDEAQVLAEMEERDARDSGRELDPLRPAADAWWLDSTGLGIGEVTELIVNRARDLEKEGAADVL